MYKKIDFTKLEGLAVYQDTLDFLQTSYRDAISAIAKALGTRVIVTGVIDQGTTYSDGWIIIDGELMPFVGGLKTTRVITEDVTGTEVFADGTTQTVYYTRRAKLGITGGFAFTEFIRIDTMSAISQGLKNLVTAHNNLQSAFNTHTHSWTQITGKPTIFAPAAHRHTWSEIDGKPATATVLSSGVFHVGDITTDNFYTIPIPYVGNTNYLVLGHLESLGNNENDDNDVFWMISKRTPSSFRLLLKELARDHQNLQFAYAIISI